MQNKEQNSKITEAIVLAGGFGTRLASVVSDVPKCLAPINGIPFLDFVLQYGFKQGIKKFILSVGYKKELIIDFIASKNYEFEVCFCEEDEPLGTGGAIQKSLSICDTNYVLALNGDTLFEYQLDNVELSDCSIFLKPMKDFDRYGSVEIDNNCRIKSFKEKQKIEEGLINSGVYVIDKNNLLDLALPEKFSFEKDYLERYVSTLNFIGLPLDAYFIDIGIPQDFARAQDELSII